MNQRGMGSAKTFDDGHKPIRHQPWRNPAVRVHSLGRTMKATLPCLPKLHTQKQCANYGLHCILKIGNQLDWQQREGLPCLSA